MKIINDRAQHERAIRENVPTWEDLVKGLSEKDLSLTPMCNACGWRKGGLHSWNGRACKCGHVSATFRTLLSNVRVAS